MTILLLFFGGILGLIFTKNTFFWYLISAPLLFIIIPLTPGFVGKRMKELRDTPAQKAKKKAKAAAKAAKKK